MTSRHVAFALLALAALLYLGFARPWGAAELHATNEHARLLRSKRQASVKTAALERRTAQIKNAVRIVSTKQTVDRPLTHVRRIILAALESAPVSGIRLRIRASSRGGSVKAHLRARGRFVDLGRLAGRIARSDPSFAFERITLAPAETGATLELDIIWIGGGS
jgi:hypothetical protein